MEKEANIRVEKKKIPHRTDDFPIRTINLKLIPEEKEVQIIENDIELTTKLSDEAVNRYIMSKRIPPFEKDKNGNPTSFLSQAEKKEFHQWAIDLGVTGTFFDLVAGSRGAEGWTRSMLRKTASEIRKKDELIKVAEKQNPNLIKPLSVWFQDIKPREDGSCVMCGVHEKMKHKSNEYGDEYLCDACFLDFIQFGGSLHTVKRHVKLNYYLCKRLSEKTEISNSLMRIIRRYDRPKIPFENTITNTIRFKNKTVKIDFDQKIVTMKSATGRNYSVKFTGENYYESYPKYGLNAKSNKFKELITKFLISGYPSMFKRYRNGKAEYFLSIPTHYPASPTAMPVSSCILISDRSVLIYTQDSDGNGHPEFIKLYKPYLRKKVFDRRRQKIKDTNKSLRLFNWKDIEKRPKRLIRGFIKTLKYTWVEQAEISTSDDGQTVNITANGNINKKISITNDGKGKIVMHDVEDTKALYIVRESKKVYLGLKPGDICIKEPVEISKKYMAGNLYHYIDHQNKVIARTVVERLKQKIQPRTSVATLNYTSLHAENEEQTVPRAELNMKIKSMLEYDGLYRHPINTKPSKDRGSIYWSRAQDLMCSKCGEIHTRQENRLIIRDILLSNINSFECTGCDHNQNSGLLWIAENIMGRNIEELLKPLNKKEEQELAAEVETGEDIDE